MHNKSETSLENVVGRLRADHREIKALLCSYEGESSPEARKQVLSRLCRAVRLHFALEGGVFIPAVADASGNSRLLERTGTAYAYVTGLLNELSVSNGATEREPKLVTELHGFIDQHIADLEAEDGALTQAYLLAIDWEAIETATNQRRNELDRHTPFERRSWLRHEAH